MTLSYLYSKFIKKVLKGKSIVNSCINDATAKINLGSSIANYSIGAYSYCGYGCELNYVDDGRYCSFANDVIIGGKEHPMKWLSISLVFQGVNHCGSSKRFAKLQLPPPKKTIVGNDVWIGNRVIIMQGVRISDGAVIGAGAVVAKDVPPHSVVAGVLAKVIKYRFDDKITAELLKLAQWNMSKKDLQKHSDKVNNVIAFLESIYNQVVIGGGKFLNCFLLDVERRNVT